MQSELLFSGDDLVVRGVDCNSDCIVISFSPLSSRSKIPPLELTGFGESMLRAKGVSHVVVIARSNHWWQTDEMTAALAAIMAWLAPRRAGRFITTYGASMGAYGALLFADRLKATNALALAPQFSIDPKKVPEERRWPTHSQRLTFFDDDLNGSTTGPAAKFILYDPYSEDRQHADLFKGPSIRKVRVCFASHAVGGFLNSTRELSSVMAAMFNGKLSQARLEKIVARAFDKRRKSEAYYAGMLRHYSRQMRIHGGIHDRLAAHALSVDPKFAKAHFSMALSKYVSGDTEAALAHLDAANAIKPSATYTMQGLLDFVEGYWVE